MFWILRKIFGIAVVAALIFAALQMRVGGRPLKEYVVGLYQSPFFQEGLRQAKDAVTSYLQKDLSDSSDMPDRSDRSDPLDRINDDEREELEKVLKNYK